MEVSDASSLCMVDVLLISVVIVILFLGLVGEDFLDLLGEAQFQFGVESEVDWLVFVIEHCKGLFGGLFLAGCFIVTDECLGLLKESPIRINLLLRLRIGFYGVR